MEARCQCGAVRFTTPISKPLALYICHCAECRRQTSSAFGTSAIFPRFPLPQSEDLSCYNGHTLYCYFCRVCGARLIHSTPGKNVVSVKGGCLDGLDWKAAIHIWTKSAMMPIPEGSETHDEEPTDSEYSVSQETLDQPLDRAGFLVNNAGFPEATKPEEVEELGKLRGSCELSGV